MAKLAEAISHRKCGIMAELMFKVRGSMFNIPHSAANNVRAY
jgi:hypothetical protein